MSEQRKRKKNPRSGIKHSEQQSRFSSKFQNAVQEEVKKTQHPDIEQQIHKEMLEIELKALKDTVSDLNDKYKTLIKNIQIAQNRFAISKDDIASLERQHEKKTKELKHKSSIPQAREEVLLIQQKLDNLRKEIDNLHIQLSKQRSKKSFYNRQIQKFSKQINDIETQLQQTISNIKTIHSELNEPLTEDNTRLYNQILKDITDRQRKANNPALTQLARELEGDKNANPDLEPMLPPIDISALPDGRLDFEQHVEGLEHPEVTSPSSQKNDILDELLTQLTAEIRNRTDHNLTTSQPKPITENRANARLRELLKLTHEHLKQQGGETPRSPGVLRKIPRSNY